MQNTQYISVRQCISYFKSAPSNRLSAIVSSLQNCTSVTDFFSIQNEYSVSEDTLLWIYVSFFRDKASCQSVVMSILSLQSVTTNVTREMIFVFGPDIVKSGYKYGITSCERSYNSVRINETIRDYTNLNTSISCVLFGVCKYESFPCLIIRRVFAGKHKYQSYYNECVFIRSYEDFQQFCHQYNLSVDSFMTKSEIDCKTIQFENESHRMILQSIDNTYFRFEKLNDGIYNITKQDLCDFVNWHRLKANDWNLMTLHHKYIVGIKMIKRDGYYLFLGYDAKNKLYLMYGGRPKKIEYDVNYCYDHMLDNLAKLDTLCFKYDGVMKIVSNYVKSVGGSGHVHGCIVDFDFFNHVYVNLNDMKLTYYFANNKRNKYVYTNLSQKGYLTNVQDIPLLSKHEDTHEFQLSISAIDELKYVSDTKIYSMSDKMKHMKFMYDSHIISDEVMFS